VPETPACPICGKPPATETRPFCSSRCAQIDLGRWLTEHYVVPGADGEASEAEAVAQEDGGA
jgi:endogenous inhibitor of DNA gyrase (YacG/DUF329 family)